MKKWKMILGSTLMVMTLVLSACGGTKTDEASASKTDATAESTEAAEVTETAESEVSTESKDEPVHVVVACVGSYEPYNFVDENDELRGFDMDVMKAVDAASPEIDCEFTWVAWDSLLAGVDAGRFDMIASQICYTDERAEMYHLSPEPYMVSEQKILTTDAHSDWKSLDDAKGAKIAVTAGTLQSELAEKYLEEHPDYYEIVYYEGTLEYYLADVSSGKVDATIEDPAVGLEKANTLGFDNIIAVGDSLDNSVVYFLFSKTDKGAQIQEAVDKAYKQLLADGTVSKIAEEYLGSTSPVTQLKELGYYSDVEIK